LDWEILAISLFGGCAANAIKNVDEKLQILL